MPSLVVLGCAILALFLAAVSGMVFASEEKRLNPNPLKIIFAMMFVFFALVIQLIMCFLFLEINAGRAGTTLSLPRGTYQVIGKIEPFSGETSKSEEVRFILESERGRIFLMELPNRFEVGESFLFKGSDYPFSRASLLSPIFRVKSFDDKESAKEHFQISPEAREAYDFER